MKGVNNLKKVARGVLRSLVANRLLRNCLQKISRQGFLSKKVWQRLPAEGDFQASSGPDRLLYKGTKGDVIARVLFWRGWRHYEPETIRVFHELAKKASLVLDVGANTGLFSLVACASNPKAKVRAFEPVSGTCRRIKDNMQLNGWQNRCEVHNVAVSDQIGVVSFHVPEGEAPSSASMHVEGFRGHQGSLVEVPMTTVDAICEHESVDLIKLDVEGFEDKALAGMKELLERSKPTIVVECNPDGPYREVEKILKSLGYNFFHLRDEGPIAVEQIIPDSTERYRNFLCLHPSRQDSVYW